VQQRICAIFWDEPPRSKCAGDNHAHLFAFLRFGLVDAAFNRKALAIGLKGACGVAVAAPITNHQSPITNHQSPITNHQSPITNHQVWDRRKTSVNVQYCDKDRLQVLDVRGARYRRADALGSRRFLGRINRQNGGAAASCQTEACSATRTYSPILRAWLKRTSCLVWLSARF
jgi:hypothetical protein